MDLHLICSIKYATIPLRDKEAIAKDQDSLGKQGYKIKDEENFEIYLKPLSNGDSTICFFNRGGQGKTIDVNWSEYKIANNLQIRDVWKHINAGTTLTKFNATLASHDVVMLRLGK